MTETECPTCHQPIPLGAWPFCPHGVPVAGMNVIDDHLEGGARWCETLGKENVWFDGTKSQWKRVVEAHGAVCVGERKPASYFAKQRKMHDEQLRDTRKDREHAGYRE